MPNLSGITRLTTDPILNDQQNSTPIITDYKTDDKGDENESFVDTELIPIYKFYKEAKIIELLEKGIDTDFMNWNIWDLYDIADHYTLTI